MRITQNMMSRTLLDDLQNVTTKLSSTQHKLSSGKELTAPSDDPFGASQAMLFRNDIAANEQYQRNVGEASSWQQVTDTALSKVNDAVLRARDLLVQGASDTASQNRGDIASEIDQLIDSIKSDGNAQYAGRYVFAGSATLTQPYQMGASDAYAGNSEIVSREIGQGVRVSLNLPGSSVLGDSSGGLLKVLRDISNDLRTNNSANLQGADLKALDAAHDTLTNSQAVVGALANRLDTATARLQELQEAATSQLSKVEDADMPKTLIDLSTQQAVYQAALKSGANLIQPSLMDFLH
jgi:flagellar hook-associated protein 3 FlgL